MRPPLAGDPASSPHWPGSAQLQQAGRNNMLHRAKYVFKAPRSRPRQPTRDRPHPLLSKHHRCRRHTLPKLRL
eukprot:352825-Chlamydomonas_euryale.AAC.1